MKNRKKRFGGAPACRGGHLRQPESGRNGHPSGERLQEHAALDLQRRARDLRTSLRAPGHEQRSLISWKRRDKWEDPL